MTLYHRPIDVTDNSGSSLSNYQTKITFGSTDPIFTNGSSTDLRFRDGNGTLLDHWVKNFDATNETATIWVKVPSIPANGTTTIHGFYGDGVNANPSSGDATFLVFDDFDDGAVDTTKWGTSGTVAESGGTIRTDTGQAWGKTGIAGDFKLHHWSVPTSTTYTNTGHMTIGVGETSAADTDDGYCPYFEKDNTFQVYWHNAGGGHTSLVDLTSPTWTAGAFEEMVIERSGDTFTSTWNGTQLHSGTNTAIANTVYPWVTRANNKNDGPFESQLLFAREYASAEPSVTLNTEIDPTPTSVDAAYTADDQVDLSWMDNWSYEDDFTVQISRDGGSWASPSGGPSNPGANSTSASYGPNSDTAYDRQVGIDSSFSFRVRANGLGENTSWANSDTVYTTPVPPHNPSVSRPDANTIDVTFVVQSDVADIVSLGWREDTGSGYGSWTHIDVNGNETWYDTVLQQSTGSTYQRTKGNTVTFRWKVGNSYETFSPQADARYQFRLRYYNNDGANTVVGDWVFADYGNSGNVFFEDDFEDQDLAEWSATTLQDADSGIQSAGSTAMGISGADQGTYYLRLDENDYVDASLGDLSGERDVIVKAAVATGSMDTSGEKGKIYFYDGASWQPLKYFHWEYNRQGWVEMTALVPNTYLSTNNTLRIRGDGLGGDQFAVDRVVVSDLLHEYTKPSAPTATATDTSIEDEVTWSWTNNASFAKATDYELLWRATGVTSWNKNYSVTSLTSKTITGLSDGEEYEGRSRVLIRQDRNGVDRNSAFYTDGPIASGITILPSPTSLSITGVAADEIDLLWENNTPDHDGLRLYRSASSGTGTGDYVQLDDFSPKVEYVDSGLDDGETYYYRVSCYTEHTESLTSEVSATTDVFTDVRWKWNENSDSTGLSHDANSFTQGYEHVNLKRGLFAYYPTEHGQSTHLHDAVRDNHGVINGASWVTNNDGSNALDFNGTSDYAVSSDNLDIVGSSHTILAWVKFDTVPSSNSYVYSQSNARNAVWCDGSRARVHALDSGGTLHYGDTSFSPSSGTWYLIGQRFDNDTTEINSIIDGSVSGDLTNTASRTVADLPLYMGANSASGGFLDCTIGEMYVYNRFLSVPEITALYNLTDPSGTVSTTDPRDGLVSEYKLDGDAIDSVGTNDGTVSGATFVTAYENQGASFDGTGDYIYSNIGDDQKWTASCWVNANTISDDGMIIMRGKGSEENIQIYTSSAGTAWRSYVRDSAGTSYSIDVSRSHATGEWVHLLSTWDGQYLRLYVNGKLGGETDTGGVTLTTPGNGAHIGARWDSTAGSRELTFNGTIDEARLYSRPLSPVEVEQLHHLGQQRIARNEVLY